MSLLKVLVVNTKGGCGKTTVATNLASAFARGGLATALADVDRQRSSLAWLKARPGEAPRIAALDWVKDVGSVPKGTTRLVIDAPAALRRAAVDDLIKEADLVVVPVLASTFDAAATSRFLEKLDKVKPVRKGRKPVAVVANRIRPRARATQALLELLAQQGRDPVATLTERAVYADVAQRGLGLFDLDTKAALAVQDDWLPLIRVIEGEV